MGCVGNFQPPYIIVFNFRFYMNGIEMSRRILDRNKHHNKVREDKIGLVLVLRIRTDKIKPSGNLFLVQRLINFADFI